MLNNAKYFYPQMSHSWGTTLCSNNDYDGWEEELHHIKKWMMLMDRYDKVCAWECFLKHL